MLNPKPQTHSDTTPASVWLPGLQISAGITGKCWNYRCAHSIQQFTFSFLGQAQQHMLVIPALPGETEARDYLLHIQNQTRLQSKFKTSENCRVKLCLKKDKRARNNAQGTNACLASTKLTARPPVLKKRQHKTHTYIYIYFAFLKNSLIKSLTEGLVTNFELSVQLVTFLKAQKCKSE